MNGSRSGRSVRVLTVLVLAVGLLATTRGSAVADDVELSVWSYLPPDDPSVKAYIQRFEEQNPGIKIKYTAYPEDDFQDKMRTALTAGSPPDIAPIEAREWMKAGLVVELTEHYAQWGVAREDFNPGGLARATPQGDVAGPLYGVGDFLGGNVLFYNKTLFDQAGLPYPPVDRSLTWPEYADICRKLGKPDRNPANAVYGCSVPFWGFDIRGTWAWGPDGRTCLGYMNSPAMIEAWNLGTALVRDRYAPSTSFLATLPAAESDLFAQGKLGITWSDFTEAAKYQANGIAFGLAPFMVISGEESYVDTWTVPWGTFTQSEHPQEALLFLQFLATEGQRIRAETSSDPPLSTKVAQELEWGAGDPVKQEYLAVLQQAKPQIFVPPLPEGEEIYDREEIYRLMTVEGQTDAKPILDEVAAKTQPALDQAWQDWEALTPGQGG